MNRGNDRVGPGGRRGVVASALLGVALACCAIAACAETRPAPSDTNADSRERAAPPRPRPEAELDAERLMANVRALPTKRAAYADEPHMEGLRRTEVLLADMLREMGHEPVMDPVDFIGSRSRRGPALDSDDAAGNDDSRAPWNNVYVDIPGIGPAANEWLIFGAHFDAVANSPGADDNGTGTAALLEIARVLKGRPMQRSVRLIFFNLEEVGLVGARAHALRVKEKIDAGEMSVAGMVSMDMLGYYSDKPNSQRSPIPRIGAFEPPTVADFIAMGGILAHRTFSQALDRAMRESAPELKTVVVDFLPVAPPDLLRSDHAPFLAIGVPAVIVSDTANFRSPHYHRPSDTVETLDAERFAICARGMAGALYRLAGPIGEPLIDLASPGAGEIDPVPTQRGE
ncbi:MAG: M28 family peptidase [Phycisphaeraceae bacterium]|nr:M28 family peptidase [Phycisphaeraceae bacterium]